MKLLPRRRRRFHTALMAAITAMSLGVASDVSAQSGSRSANTLTSEQSMVNRDITQTVERMDMLVKSSRILTLDSRIPRFQIHNEAILTATPISENQIQLYAKTAGTTQINLWDNDKTLYTVEVTVNPDAREVEGILSSQLPFATLKVLPVGGGAIISGSVTSVDDVDRAVAIAEQFYPTIVNNIKVVGVQQVLLHTRIMEVSRTKLRALGVDWIASSNSGFSASAPGGILGLNATSFVDGAVNFAPTSINQTNAFVYDDFIALVDALKEQQLVKFLAEPTVVATHGRPARFNVGGRVPFITPGGNGNVTVGYEEFGTSVDFLPFVIGPGRVRLEVRPEVTELDPARAVNVQGTFVPGFSQRYVETAVELQVGQTFALAGLLQSRTDASSRSTPILGELPIFGSLFRRVTHERNDIELLITVTPELVAGMDPHQTPVGGPGLNSMPPSDKELFSGGLLEVPNLQAAACSCPAEAHGHSANAGGISANAVVPGEHPVVVGEGVTVEVPQPDQTYFNAPEGNLTEHGFSDPGTIVEGY